MSEQKELKKNEYCSDSPKSSGFIQVSAGFNHSVALHEPEVIKTSSGIAIGYKPPIVMEDIYTCRNKQCLSGKTTATQRQTEFDDIPRSITVVCNTCFHIWSMN